MQKCQEQELQTVEEMIKRNCLGPQQTLSDGDAMA